MSKAIFQGQCLCKNVSVKATPENTHVDVCHCSMCRKWSGGALFALDCGTQAEFTGKYSAFDSSPWAERGFCPTCGTHLFYRLKTTGQYIIPADLFDNATHLSLHTQIFIDEKPHYYNLAEATHTMTGAEVFAAFAPPSD